MGRGDIEIDLVAVNEEDEIIRFGHCKRSAASLRRGLSKLNDHIERFMKLNKRYRTWSIERVAIAPVIEPEERQALGARGCLVEDLRDLTQGL